MGLIYIFLITTCIYNGPILKGLNFEEVNHALTKLIIILTDKFCSPPPFDLASGLDSDISMYKFMVASTEYFQTATPLPFLSTFTCYSFQLY